MIGHWYPGDTGLEKQKEELETLSMIEKLMILWFTQEKLLTALDNCKADSAIDDPVKLAGAKNSRVEAQPKYRKGEFSNTHIFLIVFTRVCFL